eukprot:COSAG06_NODE_11191_length_1548_cov_2.719490_1_plen_141_part_00
MRNIFPACATYTAVDPSGKVSLLALLLDRHSKDQFMVILLTFVPVRKRISLLRHFILATIILPRQAGDKRTENSKRHTCFAGGLYGNRRLLLALLCKSLPKALRDAVSSNIEMALQFSSVCPGPVLAGKPLSHFLSVSSF